MKIEELDDAEHDRNDDGCHTKQIVKVDAKRALVGAGARILFYPTLLYNVFRNKIQAEFRWWDEVDQVYFTFIFIFLGFFFFPVFDLLYNPVVKKIFFSPFIWLPSFFYLVRCRFRRTFHGWSNLALVESSLSTSPMKLWFHLPYIMWVNFLYFLFSFFFYAVFVWCFINNSKDTTYRISNCHMIVAVLISISILWFYRPMGLTT